MTFVQRANVVLEVQDDAVERMRDMGYSVIDQWGNVIKSPTPHTVSDFKEIVATQKKKIADLEAEIADLNGEIAKLKAKKTSRKK